MAKKPGTAGVELEEGPGAFDPNFETSSEFVTRMPELAPGLPDSPHMDVQIYYSRNIEPVLGSEAFEPLPQGTVAIKKQDRTGDGTVDQLMVMIKKPPGTDADRGDWSWEQRDPTSFEIVSASEADPSFRDFCANCHVGFDRTDWLAGTTLAD